MLRKEISNIKLPHPQINCMKVLKPLLATFLFYLLFLTASVQFSACKKKDYIYDTAIVHVHDTTIVHDTVYDIKEGMVAYYNFNGGNLNDSSGNNNNIVFNNATKTADRFGNPNNAYISDGITSYMKVTNSSTLNPYSITLMAIVKFNGFYHGDCHANQVLMKGFQDQSDGVYGLRASDQNSNCSAPVDTTKEVIWGNYGNNQLSSIVALDNIDLLKTNKWMIVVYTYDGLHAKIYLDGQLKATTNGTVPFSPNGNDLFIGKTENPLFPYLFNGVIDEIRIYNRALGVNAINQFQQLKQ